MKCQMCAFRVPPQRSPTLVLSSTMHDNMCKAGPINLDIIPNDEISQDPVLGNLSLLDHSRLKDNFGKRFILVDEGRRRRNWMGRKEKEDGRLV